MGTNTHDGHDLFHIDQVERSARCEVDGNTLVIHDDTEDVVVDDLIWCNTCDRKVLPLEFGVFADDLTKVWV